MSACYLSTRLLINFPVLKYVFNGHLGGFFLGELLAPPYPFCCFRAVTGVVILQVTGGLFVLRVLPVVPSGRHYVAAKVAVHKQGVSVWTPRTAEIYFVYAGSGGQTAMVEHVAESHVLRS